MWNPARPNRSIVDCCMLPLGSPMRSVDSGRRSVISFWIWDFGLWISGNKRGRSQSKIRNPQSKISSRFCLLAPPLIQCHRLAHRHEKLIALLGGEMMLDEFLGVLQAGAFIQDLLVHQVFQ